MKSSRYFKLLRSLIRENSECCIVRDANGVTLARLFCRGDSKHYNMGASKAHFRGSAISRLPEFLTPRRGFIRAVELRKFLGAANGKCPCRPRQ
jgi:hypothetical protein